MAKKKKKSKKNRKAESKKLLNIKPEQLVIMGGKELESGNIRSAIALYKQALKNNGDKSQINMLMFRAYLMRNKQLQNKGMKKEAAVTLENAIQYKPDAKDFSENDLIDILKLANKKAGTDIYNEYLSENKTLHSAEKIIAEKILESGDISCLKDVADNSLLHKNSQDLNSAFGFMNAGEWEDALAALKIIPRISPWAGVKMFCKSMTSFLGNERKTLQRSLASLPEDFPFPSTQLLLNQSAKTENRDCLLESSNAADILFEGSKEVFPLIENLVEKLQQKNTPGIALTIKKLATSLYPQDIVAVQKTLLDVIWQRCQDQNETPEVPSTLTYKLLPKADSFLTFSKAQFNYGPEMFEHAVQYLGVLDRQFPDSSENIIARSEIFTHMAYRVIDQQIGHYEWEGYDGIVDMMPLADDSAKYDRKNAAFLLLENAVNLDPDNRSAYELVEKSYTGGIPQKRLEAIYKKMMDSFLNDPYSCLQLADLYDIKGAFRKAEKILNEAMKRAPLNKDVLERYAFSFVVSAEKNLLGKKLHLVEKDLQKAVELNIQDHTLVVIEKKVLLQLMNDKKSDPVKIITENLSSFSALEFLRILSLLICDMGTKKISTSKIEKIFKKNLKNISSKDKVALLMPVNKMHKLAFKYFALTELFIKHDKKFLTGITDGELLNLLTVHGIITQATLPEFIKTFKERQKKAGKEHMVSLAFCLAALKYIKARGKDYELEELLDDIIYDIPPEIEKRLRIISTNFSSLASGAVRRNLIEFDFVGGFDPFMSNFDQFIGPADDMPFKSNKDLDNFIDSIKDEVDDEFEQAEQAKNKEKKEAPVRIKTEVEIEREKKEIFESLVVGLTKIKKDSPADVKEKFVENLNTYCAYLALDGASVSLILSSRQAFLGSMLIIRPFMEKTRSALGKKYLDMLSAEAYVFLAGKLRE